MSSQSLVIDGEELASLMVENEIGAAKVKAFTVYEVNENHPDN